MPVKALLLVVLAVASSGCVGYNRTLFFTTANVGLDVDTSPPTAEVSISRRENVIGPSLEGGIKPPVLASFRSAFTGILGVMANVSSTFAGGDAAETMAKLFDDTYAEGRTIPVDSTRCVSARPSARLFGRDIVVPGPGEVRPFVFGTDTTFGLKVAWTGVTAEFPDSVKLGYNRKEWALAAVYATPAYGASGTVTRVVSDGDRNAIVFDDGRTYALTGRSVIVRNGQPIRAADVAAGDSVAIYRASLAALKDGKLVPIATPAGVRNAPCGWGEWEIHMPSFLATIDHRSNIGRPGDTGTDHVQLFATGTAADNLAVRDAVRATMIQRLDPKIAARLKTFKAEQTKQIDLVKSIQATFRNANAATKAKILQRAKDLGLVPKDTTDDTFGGNLSDVVDGSKDSVTSALEKLKTFAESA